MSTPLGEFDIGVIEGFFGKPWSWSAREAYAEFLAEQGYAFYILAPKDDAILRKRWRDDWSEGEWAALSMIRESYRKAGVLFGLGLSPWELYKDYDGTGKADLEAKVHRLDMLKPDILAILFDDMPGASDELASVQARITMDALNASTAPVAMACPTFYSDDPVYEDAYGAIPPSYLRDFATGLDPAVHVHWTGPITCSKDFPAEHLANVAERMGRKPFIWDNYPVNDGPIMAKKLNLRAFENRGPELKTLTTGLAANPMNEAFLSWVPLATLPKNIADHDYDRDASFREAAATFCGEEMGTALVQDLALFHDVGLDGIDESRATELSEKYKEFGNVFALEIIRWLAGDYAPSAEVLAEFEGWGSE